MGNCLFYRKADVMKLPGPTSFAYTGGIQTYTVPEDGLYKLEVWGAKGGQGNPAEGNKGIGGLGGYSVGYVKINKGTTLYVVCGGSGGNSGNRSGGSAGYNGGGTGTGDRTDNYWYFGGAGGGGATHIALVTGTLPSIGKTSFDANGLIIAGGGGGGAFFTAGSLTWYTGGVGGGPSGGGGAFGQGSTGPGVDNGYAGGGGGYAGGSTQSTRTGAAKGGTGWIGGVPAITYRGITYSPNTIDGQNNDSGKAIITPIMGKVIPHRSIIAKKSA